MADILGATSRQMYDMTYRLINQDAVVVTKTRPIRCRLGGAHWSRKDQDGTLNLLAVVGENGEVAVKYSDIKSIELV